MNTINLQLQPEFLGLQAKPEQGFGKSTGDAFMQQITVPAQFGGRSGLPSLPMADAPQTSDELTDPIAGLSSTIATTTAELVAVRSQLESTTSAAQTLQVAELYESKHIAIGQLSYLDSETVRVATTSVVPKSSTAPKQTSFSTEVSRTAPLLPAQEWNDENQKSASILTSESLDKPELSSRENERLRQSIVHLPEMLAPWMRRRVSVSSDERSIQILVRDYEASSQELSAIVDAVLSHVTSVDDGRKLVITVNGKSVQGEIKFTGEKKNAG